MRTLADRLKRARLKAGYESATEAAERNGWNPNTYRSIENGNRQPSSANAIEFADAFDVRIDWLLTGRGSMIEARQRQVPIFYLSDIINRTNDSRRALSIVKGARGFLTVPEAWQVSRRAFAVEIAVSDDSMVERPATARSLYPGDTIICDPEAELYPGCIVVALAAVDDKLVALVRELKVGPRPGRYTLTAFNDRYPDVPTNRKGIIGVMVGMYRRPAKRG